MRRRPLDDYVLDQNTTLWIVLGAAVCLILGIVLRAVLAERRKEREQKNVAQTDRPRS
jgi:hypothetical protein